MEEIAIFLEVVQNPTVARARHDADNALAALLLQSALMKRTADPVHKEQVIDKMLDLIKKASEKFDYYIDLRTTLFLERLNGHNPDSRHSA